MFTKKQLAISLGLATIVKVMIITPANAKTDNIGAGVLDSPSGTASYNPGEVTSGQLIFGDISIPPGMNVPGGGTVGTSPGGSDSSSASTGDGTTSGTGDGSSSTGTVTVADIADYFASNIEQSIENLDTSNIAQGPRRIVRRRSSASCPNPQISRSSESLDDLLNQSEQFLEQVERAKSGNSSIW